MNRLLPLLVIMLVAILSGCRISSQKNIIYDTNHKLALDVYSPRSSQGQANVLVFIHGGSWQHGKKSIYRFFGRGMARKGIVTVVIDFRQYPETDIEGITGDVAASLKWVADSIRSYGGSPSKIFVAGHSAGGHLAAMVAIDSLYPEKYGTPDPVKGVVLIDPFGLDMYNYLQTHRGGNGYTALFGQDPENWKKESPAYHLHSGMPPFIIFLGGRTYSNIIAESHEFADKLMPYQSGLELIVVPKRRHTGMIFSFLNPFKDAYGQIKAFMNMTADTASRGR